MKTKIYQAFLLVTLLALLLGACKPVSPQPPVPTEPPVEVTQALIDQPTRAPATQPTATRSAITATQPGLQAVDPGTPLPPQVIDQQPQGADELPDGGVVVLTFDQAMDPSATATALEVLTPEGRPVQGDVRWADERTLQFKPGSALESGKIYYASLGTGARSAAGVEMAEPYTFQFLVAGDLQVSQVFPAPGAQDVGSEAVITVIFNRPVAPLVISEEMGNLPNPLVISPDLPGKGEWVNTSVYAFRPEKGFLASGTSYQITVKAGLQDATGDTSLAEDYTWNFTTGAPRIDYFTVSNRLYNPDNNADRILLDDYFYVRFLQPMDHPSTETAITLTGGPSAGLTYEWSDDSLGVTITPTARLALGTNYLFQVGTGAHAANGGQLTEGMEWSFNTVPPPAILQVIPADGSKQDSYSSLFEIKFASPMRIDTVKNRIVITPKPKDDIEWYYNEWDWSMSAWFLEPATDYEVRFLPGMQDIYGNTIGREQVVRFTTGNKDPGVALLMPMDMSIMRAEGPEESQEFYTVHVNVKEYSLLLGQLDAEQVLAFQNGTSNPYEYRIPSQQIVWQTTEQGNPTVNQRTVRSFRPTINGGPLPAGFYYLAMDSPSVHHQNPYADHRILVVANATLTLKTTDVESLTWVTDLETGEPVSGAPVRYYGIKGELLDEVNTDSDGLAYSELPAPTDSYEQRFAIVDDEEVFGYAQTQWGSGVQLYDYGIWTDFYNKPYQPRAYLYTERPIYRPGQPVYFKGIVRVDNDLDYRLPTQSQVKLKISNYQGDVTEMDLPLSENGTFNGEFKLDPEAALGYYTMDVRLVESDRQASDQIIGSITFSVAEYRKPEFQVNVSASPEDLLANESFTAMVQADYYSGGGLSGAQVKWTLTADAYVFQPPDEFSGYSFRDYEDDVYYYDNEGSSGSRSIAEGVGQTGADGNFSMSLPASLGEKGESQGLIFEATLTDLAQTAVSGRATVVAHRSQVYPGVRAQDYVGTEGEEQTFELVALDWNGAPLAGQKLNVAIVERRWYSVQEQDPSGRVEWKSSVKEIPVTSFDDVITNDKGKAQVTYTPPNGGIFRARVTALDGKGNTGAASAYQWVAGKDYIPWRQTNDRGFDLVTDKHSYQPGETAEVLIASPFQGEAYALVTVERGRIHYEEVVPISSNSTIYKLRITPDMAPNAYISVVVIKGVDETNPRPNFKIGVTQIEVDIQQKELQVEVTPDRTEAGPGEQVSYTVRTRDYAGQPVSAEVSLSLSDLATLSLLPPNSPPAIEYFYSERNLGVWTSVSIVQAIDDYNHDIRDEVQQGERGGSGGGKGEGDLGVVEVRQDFPDTAFWDAMVQTDSRGQATVVVTLPDNLTTWRMEARAVAGETRVGQTTTDIVSTRPLLVRPQTPRFFIVNDQARLGTAVHNNTGQELSVAVTLQAEGLEVQSPLSQTVTIPAGQQSFITWDVTVKPDAQRVDLIFSAEGGGLKDASRAPQGTLDNQGLPVYRYEAPETVGTSGQLLAEGTKVEGISLPQGIPAGSGEMTIRLQPSLAASMTDGLTYLKSYPYECVEQTVSRFLPNVMSTQAMQAAGINDPELSAGLQEQVDTALQRLYSLQNPDGGWGWWGDEKSDPLVSAYVALGLIEANDARYSVNQDVLSRVMNYLRIQVEPMTGLKDPFKLNRQAFILYVLARGGSPDVSSTVQLYDQRQRMHIFAQAYLAHTLYWIDSSDSRLQTLLSDFASQAITSATGSHWEEESNDRWNWNTNTRTTAIVLSALSEIDPRNPLNANAVRWLMSHRTDGHWLGTQETAWTLMALTHWMTFSGELQANYQYAVGLNGATLASGQATQDNLRDSVELKIDIQSMLQNELNRLAFTRDGGPGNLYYTAHLKVTLPVEQIQPLDRGIIVSRSYYRLDDLETPVSEARQGDLLLGRLTLVAPHDLHYVVVDDPLPAGLEGVDQSLSTSPQSVEVPQEYSWEDMFWRGWGWWSFDNIQYKDEKVVLSASFLPAGTYVYTYLVRAGTPGSFRTIPVTAQEFYFPEVYGRSAGSMFTVQP